MARPKKDKNLRHISFISCSVSPILNIEIIAENAKVASLPLAEYVRKQITNKKVIVKYEIVADLPELKKLIAEFGKIGSNLNQIARYFNTGGLHSQEMRNEIKKSITEIYKLKIRSNKNWLEILSLSMQIIEIAQEKTNMAILKHIASKNADYGETERYLIFQHDEYTQKPILDENGEYASS